MRKLLEIGNRYAKESTWQRARRCLTNIRRRRSARQQECLR